MRRHTRLFEQLQDFLRTESSRKRYWARSMAQTRVSQATSIVMDMIQ